MHWGWDPLCGPVQLSVVTTQASNNDDHDIDFDDNDDDDSDDVDWSTYMRLFTKDGSLCVASRKNEWWW